MSDRIHTANFMMNSPVISPLLLPFLIDPSDSLKFLNSSNSSGGKLWPISDEIF